MTEIVLVTREDCEFCEQAKRVLAKIAPELHLQIHQVSLESAEGRELATRAGAPFPPVVFLDGRPFSYGRLSERRLRRALGREPTTLES